MAEIEEIEEREISKDITVELNTGQLKQVSKEVFMKGKLHSLILVTNKTINIDIHFKEYPSIKLLDVVSYSKGEEYIPLRVDTFGHDKNMYNYQNSKWLLSDMIEISISGNIDTEVKFIFRFE